MSTVASICSVTICVFFFNQKTADELRISDGSSDVCSSDLSRNNLKQVDCEIPLGVMTTVTCISGSGKSSLVSQALVELVAGALEIGRASCRERVCQYV